MARQFLKGQFLVATPELTESTFAKTVIYLFEHTEEGAAGVVINRPSKLTIQELSEKIYPSQIQWDKPILIGGPVGGPLLIVHQDADWADDEVDSEIFRTVDPDKIRHILDRKLEPSLLIANYAGWGPDQLENELREGTWHVMPASPQHIFWNEHKNLWDVLMAAAQVKDLNKILKIRTPPGDPSLN